MFGDQSQSYPFIVWSLNLALVLEGVVLPFDIAPALSLFLLFFPSVHVPFNALDFV